MKKKNLLEGLSEKKYIPFLKSVGGSSFVCETEWLVRWDKETIKEYRNFKATRFQNSKYYFKEGIAVPMVKSSRLRAVLIENRLFDQSVVGVFPREEKYRDYLLAFLNSNTCSKLIKIINHTANNSANYLKKLPIILNNDAIKKINSLMSTLKSGGDTDLIMKEVDIIFSDLYKI